MASLTQVELQVRPGTEYLLRKRSSLDPQPCPKWLRHRSVNPKVWNFPVLSPPRPLLSRFSVPGHPACTVPCAHPAHLPPKFLEGETSRGREKRACSCHLPESAGGKAPRCLSETQAAEGCARVHPKGGMRGGARAPWDPRPAGEALAETRPRGARAEKAAQGHFLPGEPGEGRRPAAGPQAVPPPDRAAGRGRH